MADTATHRLTRLKLPFQTTNDSVHLGPGGKAVLAQEARSSPGRVSLTTGRLALFDVVTGTVTRTWTDPALAHRFILTITPPGDVVSFYGESTVLTPMDIHSSLEPVVKLSNSDGPYFFYADR